VIEVLEGDVDTRGHGLLRAGSALPALRRPSRDRVRIAPRRSMSPSKRVGGRLHDGSTEQRRSRKSWTSR
jgi:hypothetical protein